MSVLNICGYNDCEDFANADFIAQHLAKCLPNFRYARIVKTKLEFTKWAERFCAVTGWYLRQSPIIWRELLCSGGNISVIGSVDEFFDFCCEYYGLLSMLSRQQLKALSRENVQTYHEELTRKREPKDFLRVCISGAGNPACGLLVSELVCCDWLARKHGMHISLIENRKEYIPNVRNIARDASGIAGSEIRYGAILVMDRLIDALHDCDLLIIMNDLPRSNYDSYGKYLDANYEAMRAIANELNEVPRYSLKVVFTCIESLCFNATVLASCARTVSSRNVVAVSGHLAIEAIPFIAKAYGVPAKDFGLAPVWGFIGLNQLVDVSNADHRIICFEPDKEQELRQNSSLPLRGQTVTEIRRLGLISRSLDRIWIQIRQHKDVVKNICGHNPYLSQMRATIDLLKFWYSDPDEVGQKAEDKYEVLCAGTLTDGTFGLTEGYIFSQPVVVQHGILLPAFGFPRMPNETISLKQLFQNAVSIVSKHGKPCPMFGLPKQSSEILDFKTDKKDPRVPRKRAATPPKEEDNWPSYMIPDVF